MQDIYIVKHSETLMKKITAVSFATYDTRRVQYQNIPTCEIFITTLMHGDFAHALHITINLRAACRWPGAVAETCRANN